MSVLWKNKINKLPSASLSAFLAENTVSLVSFCQPNAEDQMCDLKEEAQKRWVTHQIAPSLISCHFYLPSAAHNCATEHRQFACQSVPSQLPALFLWMSAVLIRGVFLLSKRSAPLTHLEFNETRTAREGQTMCTTSAPRLMTEPSCGSASLPFVCGFYCALCSL